MDKEKKQRVVKCPNCTGIFHEVTNKYRAAQPANSGMLRLLPRFAALGWDEPPPDPSAGFGILECPGCGNALAPNGKLDVKLLTETELENAYRRQL